MVEINEKLDARYRQQKDGVFDEDEEWRLRQVAQSNAAVKGQVPKNRKLNCSTVARSRKILCKRFFFSKNLLIFAAKFHINFLTNEKQVFYPKLYEGHGCLHVCNNAVGWFYRLYSQ